MASTVEHRSKAEEHLNKAATARRSAQLAESDWQRDAYMQDATLNLRFAQVHATLAVAK